MEVYNAVKARRVDGVRRNVTFYTDINSPNRLEENYTPLHRACLDGSDEIVEFLLSCPNLSSHKALDKNNNTPFALACKNGHLKVVRLFLSDPKVDVNQADINGNSPFDWACSEGNVEIVEELAKNVRVEIDKGLVIARTKNNPIVSAIVELEAQRRQNDLLKLSKISDNIRLCEPDIKSLFQYCTLQNWEQVKNFCNENPHLVLPSDFFENLPLNVSFYSSQVIFNTLYDMKQNVLKNLPILEDLNEEAQNSKERFESMIARYEKTKKDRYDLIVKLETELEEQKRIINQEITKIDLEIKETTLKKFRTQPDLINYQDISRVVSKIKETEVKNSIVLENMIKKMEKWKRENEEKKVRDLDSQGVGCLLSLLNVEYNTKNNISGQTLVEMGLSSFKEILRIGSIGDRKRLINVTSKKDGTIQSVEVMSLPILMKDEKDLKEEIFYEMSYKDVSNWGSIQGKGNDSIANIFKKQKLDGKQMLTLKDEELKDEELKEIREVTKEIQKMVKWMIQLTQKNGIDITEILNIPEDLKCPLTKKIMQDPVMAPDCCTYERKAIEEYFGTKKTSPVTQEEFVDYILRPNKIIKKKIEEFKKENNFGLI